MPLAFGNTVRAGRHALRSSPSVLRSAAALVAFAGPAAFSACVAPSHAAVPAQASHDVLLLGGRVLDGTGAPWMRQDVAITGSRISFLGDARAAAISAKDTVNVTGLVVTPGFIDMHSHAELEKPHGKTALPFIHQGITTVVLGVDGDGESTIRDTYAGYVQSGIAVNALRFVGHGTARSKIMGAADRPPTPAELDAMRAFVRQGMEEGAIGLSSGLFYSPGTFAETAEVIALNKVSAQFGGIYDTHDRDLGAVYGGIGFIASMKEAIAIGEEAGTPVIFSHLNMQGRQNYGRAPEAIRLIEDARARGVNVMAAQHPYTATQSNLRSYAIPDWAAVGGLPRMRERFRDPEIVRKLDVETMAMLEMRGGAEKLLFADQRAELNGKTLAQVAATWNIPVPAAVRRILEGPNASVMNLDLYDIANTRTLATMEWMMTCTDGRTPPPEGGIVHPRPYGGFTRKLRLFVLEDSLISLPFAIRSMTGLAATFLGLPDRGIIRPGFAADLAVFDVARIRDKATHEDPHQYSEGTVHVVVNGKFAIRNGVVTGTLAGVPILRGGAVFSPR